MSCQGNGVHMSYKGQLVFSECFDGYNILAEVP